MYKKAIVKLCVVVWLDLHLLNTFKAMRLFTMHCTCIAAYVVVCENFLANPLHTLF